MLPRLALITIGCASLADCRAGSMSGESADAKRLPTGEWLDPVGPIIDLGNMPLNIVLSTDRKAAVVLLSGWRQQGLQVVDLGTRRVIQTAEQDNAFLGLAWSADGHELFTSGGSADVIYRYAWNGRVTLRDSITLPSAQRGSRFVGALAMSSDGRQLYAAENLADSLAVIDVASGRVLQRVATGPYPYAIAVVKDAVFVSQWGGSSVVRFTVDASGLLRAPRSISVGFHPAALALNPAGTRLFAALSGVDRIAVIDVQRLEVVDTLVATAPAGPHEGSTPNALALSADGTRLFVAEADNNAVAVFELGDRDSGVQRGRSRTALIGRLPVLWYPTALTLSGDSLLVVSAKGRGTGPNPRGPRDSLAVRYTDPRQYTLGQLDGTLSVVPTRITDAELQRYTARVSSANRWNSRDNAARRRYPPFEHVVLIIKENRTYDQVLGDLAHADGDTSLVFFPRAISPNHHALAERFGIYDRFFVNAEVSSQGHPWTTAAYVTEYLEKTVPSLYSDKRAEDDEGGVEDPASGYLWSLALRKGISLRNYGEYASPRRAQGDSAWVYHATKPDLDAVTNHEYPSFDMRIPDQRRLAVWLSDFAEYSRKGEMPALQIMHLPGDHTAGTRPGLRTPRACMADNDLALGRIVEALSSSAFWKSTVVFVLEDDAQAGPDHVDSHRSVLLVVSPYARPGVMHRFVNTTDVLATIEEILGLDALSQFDYYGHPLREIWSDSADLRPYRALIPAQDMEERNAAGAPGARESEAFDFSDEDRVDDAAFNRVLWRALKGASVPYPMPRRASALDLVRGR